MVQFFLMKFLIVISGSNLALHISFHANLRMFCFALKCRSCQFSNATRRTVCTGIILLYIHTLKRELQKY